MIVSYVVAVAAADAAAAVAEEIGEVPCYFVGTRAAAAVEVVARAMRLYQFSKKLGVRQFQSEAATSKHTWVRVWGGDAAQGPSARRTPQEPDAH